MCKYKDIEYYEKGDAPQFREGKFVGGYTAEGEYVPLPSPPAHRSFLKVSFVVACHNTVDPH